MAHLTEFVEILTRQVEHVRVLRRPNRSEASTFPYIAQVLLVLREKTELSEVGPSAQISENDLLGLIALIVADWKLAVADF